MPRRMTLTLGLAAALVLGLAAAAWISADRTERRERAGAEALAADSSAATAIFSYDYRSFDASVTNGTQFVTGDFAGEYAETTATLKPAAEAEQAVVRAEVSAAGIVAAGLDQVEVLLYVNQYRRNVNITGEKVDQNRVVLTLVPVDGQWRVSHALAI
jgi:Mce-associated membrane protein